MTVLRGRLGIEGLLLIALALAAIVLPWAGRSIWWAELFSHFVPHYAVAGLVLGVVCTVRRRPWAAAGALAIALVQIVSLMPLWSPPPAEAGAAHLRRLTILQLNVNAYHPDPRRVVEWLMEQDSDITVLVEVPPEWRTPLAPLIARYPTKVIKLPTKKGTGIVVLSRRESSAFRVVSVGDPWCPVVILTVPSDAGRTRLALYATHLASPMNRSDAAARNRQLIELARRVEEDSSAHKIVVGDLNITRWSPWFRDLLAPAGLRDGQEGFGFHSTWPSILPRWFGVAIDQTLISAGVIVARRTIGPDVGSDHLPVITTVEFPHAPTQEADDRDFAA